MAKKIPTPETGSGRFLGGHPQLWGPLAPPLILAEGGDHTIREISTYPATNSGGRLGVMLQNNAKQTRWWQQEQSQLAECSSQKAK